MADGMLAGIGNTPAVRLTRLATADLAEVWVKLEGANPTGSYKDRMALAMIEGAERAGRLRPGQPVVEYTGGSTGSSLAFVCAVTGHPLHIVTSDAFAEEKRRTMLAFGAHVEIVPSPQGITPDLIPRMRTRAAELARSLGAYRTDQFSNTDMVEGYRRLGDEAAAQVPGDIDALCLYVGTAGCLLGVSRSLRGRYPRCSGSPWSPPSRPSCPADPPVPTASRAAASASDPTCWTRRTSTRSSRCPPRTPSRWPAGRPASRACCPVPPPGPTWSRPCSWPNGSDRGGGC
jgi:cysteine synthase